LGLSQDHQTDSGRDCRSHSAFTWKPHWRGSQVCEILR